MQMGNIEWMWSTRGRITGNVSLSFRFCIINADDNSCIRVLCETQQEFLPQHDCWQANVIRQYACVDGNHNNLLDWPHLLGEKRECLQLLSALLQNHLMSERTFKRPSKVLRQVKGFLQDDNATLHKAASVKQLKRHIDFRTLRRPSQSFDMNPIEHAWNIMKWEIR